MRVATDARADTNGRRIQVVKNQKQVLMSKQAKAIETRILDCGGRRIASIDGPSGGALDFYTINGRVIIVQDHAEQAGIEVYLSHPGSSMLGIYEEIEKIASF